MKTIKQTFIDVKLALLHQKYFDDWTDSDVNFFLKNKERSIFLVKTGYIGPIKTK